MSDIRKWKFTAGFGTTSILKNDATDMWGEWGVDGSPAVLSYTIHAQYDLAKNLSVSTDVFERRKAIENRMLSLAKYKTREGQLEIDWDLGGSRPSTITGMMLDSISPVQVDNNLILEYDLKFVYTSPGTLVRAWAAILLDALDSLTYRGAWNQAASYLANDVVLYGGVFYKAKQVNRWQVPTVNAIWGLNGTTISGTLDQTYFILDPEKPDTTIWSEVSRGQTIRIRGGVPVETLTMTGIRQKVSAADTELARRQASETLMRTWQDRKGLEFLLTLDGISYGVCHLSNIKKGSIDLPDAVTFDLVFARNYVNG